MRYLNWSFGLWMGIVWPAFGQQMPAPGPLTTEPVSALHYLQMILGLLLVLGVIFALAWVIKRMGQFSLPVEGQLKVLGGVSVGQREKVVLVQAGETQLLVGVAPGNVRTLYVFEKPVIENVSSSKPSGNAGFAERLQSVLKGQVKP